MKTSRGSKSILRRILACMLSAVLLAGMLSLPASAVNSFQKDNDYLDWLRLDHKVLDIEWEEGSVSTVFGGMTTYVPVLYVPIGTVIEVKNPDKYGMFDEVETKIPVVTDEDGKVQGDWQAFDDYWNKHSVGSIFVASENRTQFGILDVTRETYSLSGSRKINFDYYFYVVGVDTNVSQGANGYSVSGLEDYVTFSAKYDAVDYGYDYDPETSKLNEIIVYEYPVGTTVSLTEKAIKKGYKILDYDDFEEKTSLTLDAANAYRKDYLIRSDSDPKGIKLFIRPVNTNLSFVDVKADSYYGDAVKWAVRYGVTNGTGANTFSPNDTCTTGQIITFFWRACGAYDLSVLGNPFTDVSEGDYYYKAAIWAEAMDVLSGTEFNANTPCTRSAVVTYLWRYFGKQSAEVTNQFSDVPANADYAQAVAWAVERGITGGTSATTFSPNDTCTRGQIVTFLHRALGW